MLQGKLLYFRSFISKNTQLRKTSGAYAQGYMNRLMESLKRKEDEKNEDGCSKKMKTDDFSSSVPSKFGKKRSHNNIPRRSMEESLNDTEYVIDDGLRKVLPYYYKYSTHAKGRWIGKTLRELYSTEFRLYTMGYQEQAIKRGTLTINNKMVESLDTIIKDNDFISNVVHRHECPVSAQPLKIIQDCDRFLVVDKPSSIPIHPCGRFKFNTVVYILAKDHNTMGLHTFNRIDRMTSGLIIFAKTKKVARMLNQSIKKHKIEKEYICRVVGKFPEEEVRCNGKMKQVDYSIGIQIVDNDDVESKTCETIFNLMWTNGKESVLKCKPITGRTHQIRVHLQYLGFPIVNDTLYNHWSWGDDRFKPGEIKKPLSEIMPYLLKARKITEIQPVIDKVNKALEENATKMNKTREIVTENIKAVGSVPFDMNSSESKSGFVSTCHECLEPLPDPKPEELIMYLHAYKYKCDDWEFTSPIPEWAKENRTENEEINKTPELNIELKESLNEQELNKSTSNNG